MTTNWVEWFGILSCIVIVIALNFQGKKFRILNSIGSVMYVIYGILIHSPSVYLLNGICLGINIYKLIHGES